MRELPFEPKSLESVPVAEHICTLHSHCLILLNATLLFIMTARELRRVGVCVWVCERESVCVCVRVCGERAIELSDHISRLIRVNFAKVSAIQIGAIHLALPVSVWARFNFVSISSLHTNCAHFIYHICLMGRLCVGFIVFCPAATAGPGYTTARLCEIGHDWRGGGTLIQGQ